MLSIRLCALFLVHLIAGVCAKSEFGFGNFTEYKIGSLGSRIILTAPHGGYLKPKGLPTRVNGCYDEVKKECIWKYNCGVQSTKCRAATLADLNTLEIAKLLRTELYKLTGFYPHLIINHLSRRHLDPNRPRMEATLGDILAGKGWDDFHSFIEKARRSVKDTGILFDIHGQGHPENWIELGYLFSGSTLDSGKFSISLSSIANLGKRVNFENLLRGNKSLGGLLQQQGYKAVPSPNHPGPNGGKYFSGGYISRYYGSRYGGLIDAIQIESPRSLRGSDTYPKYVPKLAKAIKNFFDEYYVTKPVFGFKNYIEYIPGSQKSNIILTAPHGGYLRPATIPDRVRGCYDTKNKQCIWEHDCGFFSSSCKIVSVRDGMTQEIARELRDQIFLNTGLYPHLIINKLDRTKLDANRDIGQATLGNSEAKNAWNDFTNFINKAKEAVKNGILFDIHGVTTHPEKWIELGYGISGRNLDSGNFSSNESSVSRLAQKYDINQILKGAYGLGGYLSKEGYKTVPSPTYPSPNGGKYYRGGYITRTHGSANGGYIDAIQIESPYHLRQNTTYRLYSKNLANAIVKFVNKYYSY